MKKHNKKNWIWWKHGVVYQIYPRSFFDANNDGVGDLGGIIIKLDYLKELGIDALLLNSIFKSPCFDHGFDVSNYKDINPDLGTLKDFKELIIEAHKRNIKVILNIPLNHTSTEHPWFIESQSSEKSEKRDWYIWHKGKNKRKSPNNWKTVFGETAWTWNEQREEFYYHSFFSKQADLNWRNQSLRNEVKKIFKYWLNLGVDGIHLDVINFFIKDKDFKQNPRSYGKRKFPFDLHNHEYDINRPGVHDLMREFRRILDSYKEKILIGGVINQEPKDQFRSVDYLGNGSDELNLVMDYKLQFSSWSPKMIYNGITNLFSLLPEKSWPCNFLSNHNFPRVMSRFAGTVAAAKVARAFLLMIKGTPILYYGEEIGMEHPILKRSELQDNLGKQYWPRFKGRDLMRSPMQWNEEEHAGFSEVDPWIPVHHDYEKNNAHILSETRDSILQITKELITLRNKKESLHKGDMVPVFEGNDGIIAFFRVYNFEKILVILNFSNNIKRVEFSDSEQWKVIFSNEKIIGKEFTSLRFEIQPYEITIIESIGMRNFQVEYV